jgi:UDP-N-acetylglucosamine 2-epimerase
LHCLGLKHRSFLLATVHRSENSDDPRRLEQILSAFNSLDEPVVFPVHPRTRKLIRGYHLKDHVRPIDPVGYLDMIALSSAARMILTDSGGLQKEAYWLGVPCLTMREETEWVETVESGWNVLVGADPAAITAGVGAFAPNGSRPSVYGDGCSAEKCIALLTRNRSEVRALQIATEVPGRESWQESRS